MKFQRNGSSSMVSLYGMLREWPAKASDTWSARVHGPTVHYTEHSLRGLE